MFTQGQAIEFIEKVFGNVKLTNGGLNANVSCPICVQNKLNQGLIVNADKKKLAIRTDNFVAHCWVCGYKSRDIYNLIKRFKPVLLQEYENIFAAKDSAGRRFIVIQPFDEELPKDETIHLPAGFTLLAPHFYDEGADYRIHHAKRYLLSRGLEYKDFWYWKFGVSFEDPDYKDRVIIPSFDNTGNLNYFTSRAINPKTKRRYYNPAFARESIIFNEINIDWSKELTLVEGPFDLVKCNDNATCVLGKELNSNHLLFQRIVQNQTPVLLALDRGELRQILSTAKLLTEYGIEVRLYDLPKDKKDVGEMTKDEFISRIASANMFQMEDCLRYKLGIL